MCSVGTSPLYTFPNVFSSEPTPLDVLGAVSIIFWTITLITIVKYILIVMNFNDEGEGMPHSALQTHSTSQLLLSDPSVHQSMHGYCVNTASCVPWSSLCTTFHRMYVARPLCLIQHNLAYYEVGSALLESFSALVDCSVLHSRHLQHLGLRYQA